MRFPVLFGRTLATFGCAVAIGLPLRLPAAEELGVFVEFAAADASLNATYQRVMHEIPPAARESLRQAQRAWVAFVEKDVAAVSPLTNLEERWRLRLNETVARQKQLEAMLQAQSQADEPRLRSQLRAADKELNENYGKVLELHQDDAAAVREAQRAWIVYRDENSRACRGRETEATLLSTAQRAAQLREISHESSSAAADEGKQAPQISQRADTLPPGHKIPNPFDRAH